MQADSYASLKPDFDTTLRVAAEFCARDWRTFFYEPSALFTHSGSVYATGAFLDVTHKDHISDYEVVERAVLNLATSQIIMLRQNPPVDIAYITSTHLLSLIAHKVYITNNPIAIRNYPEKIIPLYFASFIPETVIVLSPDYIENAESFVAKNQYIIAKPLYGFGGKGVQLINSHSLEERLELVLDFVMQNNEVVLQKFIPNVSLGDKRIIMIDGEPTYAMLRVPKEGDFLANVISGGSMYPTDITSKELPICHAISSFLKKNDILIAGLDIIDGFLTEVNITSPTGIVGLEKIHNVNITSGLVDIMCKRAEQM